MTTFLVSAHDHYYDFIMAVCTPFCRIMPRDVDICGKKITLFTANIVTYLRGTLVIIVSLCMRHTCLCWASFLVMLHDFLDHLDGVVAKQQAKDGRSKEDDPAYGAFIDAQMDKLVFCLCLWTFLLLVDYVDGNFIVNGVVTLTTVVLIGMELTIACVRTTDYFFVKHSPTVSSKAKPALRAVSEGKLKQKFESVGVALLCLSLPKPTQSLHTIVAGVVCLWIASYFSYESLMHKLRSRIAGD